VKHNNILLSLAIMLAWDVSACAQNIRTSQPKTTTQKAKPQKPGFWTRTKTLLAALGVTAVGVAATIYFTARSSMQADLDNKLVRAAIDYQGDDNDYVGALLVHGASPNAEDPSGIGVLQSVIEDGKKYTFDLLLSKKPYLDVNSADSRGMTPLQAAAYTTAPENISVSMMQALFAHGAERSVNKTTKKYPETPLMIAANNRDLQVVNLLLSHKANPNARTADGTTVLMQAIKDNPKDTLFLVTLMSKLTAAGARVDVKNDAGETALSIAGSYSTPSVVSYLVDIRKKQQ